MASLAHTVSMNRTQAGHLAFRPSRLSQPDRLDRLLRRTFPSWGRQAVQRCIAAGHVSVNGRTVWLASWQVENGDLVEVRNPPEAKPAPCTVFDDAWLIADEGDILAVNKPEGLLSEPARSPDIANLRDLARSRFGDVTLFHRLDRDTSGVILLTRRGDVNRQLSKAFQTGAVEKEYLAIVAAPNRLAPAGVITARLSQHSQRCDKMCVVEKGGQRAITRYEVVETRSDRQLVRLRPQTGRTHQLRVHLAHLNAPILGDRLYGDVSSAPRLMLHALRISVTLASDDVRSFCAPLPASFA